MEDIPSFYMMKLAYGPARCQLYAGASGSARSSFRNPVDETLIVIARALRKRIGEVIVMVLDRPRHQGPHHGAAPGGRGRTPHLGR